MDVIKASHEMTERQLLRKVRQLCDLFGLAVQHIERSEMTWLPGWPDLFILGSSALAVELKDMRGNMEPEQRAVRANMRRAGLRCLLWRPTDLIDGTIARELMAISPGCESVITAADIAAILA